MFYPHDDVVDVFMHILLGINCIRPFSLLVIFQEKMFKGCQVFPSEDNSHFITESKPDKLLTINT